MSRTEGGQKNNLTYHYYGFDFFEMSALCQGTVRTLLIYATYITGAFCRRLLKHCRSEGRMGLFGELLDLSVLLFYLISVDKSTSHKEYRLQGQFFPILGWLLPLNFSLLPQSREEMLTLAIKFMMFSKRDSSSLTRRTP